jgi:hypothetical protein
MKRRTLQERYGEDPLRYGPLWEKVRRWYPCAGKVHLGGAHDCGPGMRPAGAHHLGDTDIEGLIPCCRRFHDQLHDRSWEVEAELRKRGRTLARLGLAYVQVAADSLAAEGELPELVRKCLEGQEPHGIL